jgi:putative ABC transport system permease protein
MIRSFLKLYSMDIGVDIDRMLTMRMTLADKKYPTPEQRRLFYQAMLSRLAATPGVAATSITSAPPAQGVGTMPFEIEGRPAGDPKKMPIATTMQVSESYFDTLRVVMRQGRVLRETDGSKGSEAVVINARFASQHFPGEDPLGKRIRFKVDTRLNAVRTEQPWLTIVGVAPNVRQRSMQDVDPDAIAYTSYRIEPTLGTAILIRSHGDPAALIPAIRKAVQDVDPDQPVFGVQTMEQALAQMRWPYRVFGSLFTILAVIALVLSAVGIYAVTAYSVTQRTQEIGVRMALGAQASQVSWLILRQGLVQLLIGLTLGTAGALAAGPVLQALLVQIKPSDPVTLGAIAAVFTVVTVVACLIPARRATRLDPLAALRVE